MGVAVLTVIIPTYDSASSIEYCIESVLNQSLKDIKIIVVDDASKDDTKDIINKLKSRHEISSIYNTANQGPSICRNIGLSLCNTDYIAFLDSDDWIDMDCYKRAVDILMAETDVDMCAWDIETVYSHHSVMPRYKYSCANRVSSSYALDMYSMRHQHDTYLSPLLGNKVFRTSLIKENNLTFSGWFYEDDIFMFKYLLHSSNIAIVPGSKLYYFQKEGSLMHSFSDAMINDMFNTFLQFYKELSIQPDWEKIKSHYYSYFEKCFFNLIRLCKNSTYSDNDKSMFLALILQSFIKKTNIFEYASYCDVGELLNV